MPQFASTGTIPRSRSGFRRPNVALFHITGGIRPPYPTPLAVNCPSGSPHVRRHTQKEPAITNVRAGRRKLLQSAKITDNIGSLGVAELDGFHFARALRRILLQIRVAFRLNFRGPERFERHVQRLGDGRIPFSVNTVAHLAAFVVDGLASLRVSGGENSNGAGRQQRESE